MIDNKDKIEECLSEIRMHESNNIKQVLEIVLTADDDKIDWDLMENYIKRYGRLIKLINKLMRGGVGTPRTPVEITECVKIAVLKALKFLSENINMKGDFILLRCSDIKDTIINNGIFEDLNDFNYKKAEVEIGRALNNLGFLGSQRDSQGIIRQIDFKHLDSLLLEYNIVD